MGKFEQEFFEKHFKTIERLKAFRKKFNQWEIGHSNGQVGIEFNHHTWHFADPSDMSTQTLDEHNNPCKFISLTKHKVDKEIARREQQIQNNAK